MEAQSIISLIVQGSLLLFVASIGLRARWRDVLAALQDTGTLSKAFVAVNLVVPLAALLACTLLPVERETRIGIVIMAVSPLAPIVGGKMLKAGYDASRTVALYFWLVLITILVVPASVALLSAIYPADASASVAAVAKLVFISVILPLSAGLMVNAVFPAAAARMAPILLAVASVVVMLVVAAIIYMFGGQIIGLIGNGSLLAIVFTVAAGLAAGHALGGPTPAGRESLALAAATRHPGIAAMIASQNFEDRRVTLAIMLFLLTSVVVSAAYEQWVKRRGGASAGAATAGIQEGSR